jgi:hypothetical protein
MVQIAQAKEMETVKMILVPKILQVVMFVAQMEKHLFQFMMYLITVND